MQRVCSTRLSPLHLTLLRECVLRGTLLLPGDGLSHEDKKLLEYSITVWRTPIGESKEVLYCLTFRREWIPELNCWRDVVVKQQKM